MVPDGGVSHKIAVPDGGVSHKIANVVPDGEVFHKVENVVPDGGVSHEIEKVVPDGGAYHGDMCGTRRHADVSSTEVHERHLKDLARFKGGNRVIDSRRRSGTAPPTIKVDPNASPCRNMVDVLA